MNVMKKRTLAIVTALGLGLAGAATLVTAEADHGPMGDCGGYGMRHAHKHGERDGKNMQERVEQRLSSLKEELKLTTGQEAAWNPFAAAVTSQTQSMRESWKQMREEKPGNALERLNARIQFMEQRLTGMKAVSVAAGDLYKTLSPEQQAAMDKFFARGHRGWKSE